MQQRCRLHGDWAALKARLSSTWDTKEAEDFSQEEEEEDEEEKPSRAGLGLKLSCCLFMQYLLQSCSRWGRGTVEDMCDERRRAKASVD